MNGMGLTNAGRLRAALALFLGVVCMNTAMVGASTVATLIAAQALGSGWSGAPNAAGVLGTAIGALGLAWLMARRGRRTGVMLAYALASLGAVLATASLLTASLVLLFGGMTLLGIGNAGAQLSRYAAAEPYPPERRGFVLGAIVWAGTIGAVVGPNLIAPAAATAEAWRLPPLVGSYVLALLLTIGAGLAVATMPRGARSKVAPTATTSLASLGRPAVRVALGAMVAAHFAMVAVMTMTPLHIQQHGQGLEVVGIVLSAHMLGMFALAPLSGRLADRLGGVTTISFGIGTLAAASVLAAAAPVVDDPMLALGLFLLGYGWNLCFVGGSSLLSRGLPVAEQAQTQGAVDAVVWSTSALASLLSGALLASGGYVLVAAVGGVVAVLPIIVIVLGRGALTRGDPSVVAP
jgi:MFS family permease